MALGSSSSYYFHGDQHPVLDIRVEMVITQDVICWSSYSKSALQDPVFSFQLNAWSSPGGNAAWQQYVFLVSIINGFPTLSTRLEYWPSHAYATSGTNGISPSGEFIHASGATREAGPDGHSQVFTMPDAPLFNPDLTPSGLTLSAGTRLTIVLSNDQHGNITGVTFAAYGSNNDPWFQNNSPIQIAGLYTNPNPKSNPPTPSVPLPKSALSPIYAFQLVLVGADDCTTLLSSGAGTITCSAKIPLAADTQLPTWTGYQGFGTAETANSVYGELTALGDGHGTFPGGYFGFSCPFATSGYTPGGFLAAAPQFGDSNRTNLFAIGSSGQLTLFNVESGGKWAQHVPIGPSTFPPSGSPFAPPGAALAVSNEFGIPNRTDIFVVDNAGQLNLFWCDNGAGGWNGPKAISKAPFAAPAGASVAASRIFDAASNQTGVFLVDESGTLTVFSVANGGTWSAPTPISDSHFTEPGASVAAYADVLGQTGVFVIDLNGAMNVFLTTPSGGWSQPKIISGFGFFASAHASIAVSRRSGVQAEVYVVDNSWQLKVLSLIHISGPEPGIPGAEIWTSGTIGPAVDPISGAPFDSPGSPVAVSQQFGIPNQTDVFAIDFRGALNVFWANGDAGWGAPFPIASAGQGNYNAPAGSFLAVSNQFGQSLQTDLFIMNTAPGGAQVLPALGWPAVFWVEGSGGWNGPSALVLEV
jgi:hypothetical protein